MNELIGNRAVPIAVREKQVSQEMNTLVGMANDLEEAAGVLISAISPVCNPVPAVGEGEDCEETLVPFAEALRSIRRQVQRIAADIRSATSGLEL